MKIEIDEGMFSVEKCQENPKKLYVFGDNLIGVGKGGQAVIRDEPNTYGVSSKYDPLHSYSDERLIENMFHIDNELTKLLEVGEDYDAIVFPARGIGTGLAALQRLAPKTFIYLSTCLLSEFGFNNLAYLEPVK